MTAENSHSIAKHWRLRGARLRLEGSNCQHCGKVHFPERRVCPDCGKDNQIPPEAKTFDDSSQLNQENGVPS